MRRTILLADDSPTIHRLVTNTFADSVFDIVSVSNGEAAVRKFEEIHPHVVLADIYMPGKTGYEVCAYVRKHSEWGRTPVILLVGAFDVFDENKAREIGAVYLFKITGANGGTWTVDLAGNPPTCKQGESGSPQCTIEVADADFEQMLQNPQLGMQLYFQGKLRVTGDPMLATRLQKLFTIGG